MNLRRRSMRIGCTGTLIALVGVALAFLGDSVNSFTSPDQATALTVLLWPVSKIWLSFGMPLAAGLISVAVALAPGDRRPPPNPHHPSKNDAAARAL